MSNSPLVQYTKWSPNHSGKRTMPIKKITIHHTAGVVSVETLGNIFAPVSRQASSTYGIGHDGRIAQFVDEGNRPWTSGSPWNDQQAVTIEVSNSAVGGQWPVSDRNIKRTIELCIDIIKRNPTIDKVDYTGDKDGTFTLHKMFQNTTCPGPYLESKIPYIVSEVKKGLKPPATSKPFIAQGADGLYRIQLGAFAVKSNAENELKRITALLDGKEAPAPQPVAPPKPTYKTFTIGERVVFRDPSAPAVYSGASEGVAVPYSVRLGTYTVQQIQNNGAAQTKLLLREIQSWVYGKDMR